jgi:hypothetical protein
MTLRTKLETNRAVSFVGRRVELDCSEYRAMLDAALARLAEAVK